MRKSEIVFPKAMWRIPAERMKMRRPFDVPLSRQALAVIRGDLREAIARLHLVGGHLSSLPVARVDRR